MQQTLADVTNVLISGFFLKNHDSKIVCVEFLLLTFIVSGCVVLHLYS